jgi:hypothetical protein
VVPVFLVDDLRADLVDQLFPDGTQQVVGEVHDLELLASFPQFQKQLLYDLFRLFMLAGALERHPVQAIPIPVKDLLIRRLIGRPDQLQKLFIAMVAEWLQGLLR